MIPFSIRIAPKNVALVLACIAVYLAAQSYAGKLVQDAAGDSSSYLLDSIVRIFNINRETSIPTWFSTCLLLLCASTVAVIAMLTRAQQGRYLHHWRLLAVIFLYLSIDEAAALHEYLTDPLGEAFDTTGVLYFGWVIAGALFVGVFALAYVRFWLHLPRRTRLLFFIAALTHLSGSLVVESISANEWYLNDGSTMVYSALGTIEELMELLGMVVFLYALLDYLATAADGIQVVFHHTAVPLHTKDLETNGHAND